MFVGFDYQTSEHENRKVVVQAFHGESPVGTVRNGPLGWHSGLNMVKPHRVIGTTEEALVRAEQELGRVLPASFREWLKQHNGRQAENVEIFPVLDDRDPRKTWDSIVRQCEIWRSYCDDVFDEGTLFPTLLPFASLGTGDCYCFDYASCHESDNEPTVVHWSHETGLTQPRGESFQEFLKQLRAGEFRHD